MDEFFEEAATGTPTETNPGQTELFAVEVPLPDVKDEEVAVGHRCTFCKKPVDLADENTHSETLSWIHGKKKDSSALRKYTGRYACDPCIRVMKTGVDPREPNVFDLVDEPAVSLTIGDAVLFTDRSSAYTSGYMTGLQGNKDKLDPDLMDPEWKDGFVAGTEQREAKQWVGSPASSGE